MKYKTKPTYTDSMGSIPSFNVEYKATETKEEEFLWHINSMRRHDGLREWDLDDLRENINLKGLFVPIIEP